MGVLEAIRQAVQDGSKMEFSAASDGKLVSRIITPKGFVFGKSYGFAPIPEEWDSKFANATEEYACKFSSPAKP